MIRGLVKCSLVDYPGKVCATIFTGGCNLRCPYCYNKSLVLSPENLPAIPQAKILAFLKERAGFLDGVCLSGGEPTYQPGIAHFLLKIKKMGYAVKIDTNGFNPAALKYLLDHSLLDYVALDIKTSPARYEKAAGVAVDLRLLEETAALLKYSNLPHEFRTTAVPTLVDNKDLEAIGKLFGGETFYYLQQFRPEKDPLHPAFAELIPYEKDTLLRMAACLQPFFASVSVRGV